MLYANLNEAWGVRRCEDPTTYDRSYHGDPMGAYAAGFAPTYNRPVPEMAKGGSWTGGRAVQQQLLEVYRAEGVPGVLRVLPPEICGALRTVYCQTPPSTSLTGWLRATDGHAIACAVIFGFVFLILWDLLCRAVRR